MTAPLRAPAVPSLPPDAAAPGRRVRVDVTGPRALGVAGGMCGNAVGDGSSVTYIGQYVERLVHGDDPVTVAPEVQRALGRESVAGTIGIDEVREAVTAWRPGTVVPKTLSFAQLVEWKKQLADETGPSAVSERMMCTVAGLMESAVTAEFLAAMFPGALTSRLLHTAARLTRLPVADRGTDLLRDMLECAIFEAQRLTEPPGTTLARFVAALVHLTRADRSDVRLTEWATARGLVVQLSNALDELAHPARSLRLVVNFADIRRNSPGQAEYWLTRDGEPEAGDPLPVTHDPVSVMAVINKALTWAWEHVLHEDETLGHLDIVAPVSLLSDLMSKRWALEDELLKTFTLGARHSLLMRWSGRLSPDPAVPGAENVAEINDAARKALREMPRCADPVTWLDLRSLRPEAEEELRRRLATGRMGAAIGFSASATLDRALPVLLPYAPIIVWPRPGAPELDAAFRVRVRANWHRQPHDFADAYRRHETDHTTGQCLCDLHAVSHDEAWLNFCRLMTGRTVAAPEETQ